MLDEFEKQEEDAEVLKQLKDLKRDKSFYNVINKRHLNKFDLDDVMG